MRTHLSSFKMCCSQSCINIPVPSGDSSRILLEVGGKIQVVIIESNVTAHYVIKPLRHKPFQSNNTLQPLRFSLACDSWGALLVLTHAIFLFIYCTSEENCECNQTVSWDFASLKKCFFKKYKEALTSLSLCRGKDDFSLSK